MGVVLIGLFGSGYLPAQFGDDTIPIVGDPQNFNPITSLTAAQQLAGPENPLVAMEARFVRADGSMNLEADYGPLVVYTFRGKGHVNPDLPLGAGGGVPKDRFFDVRAEAPHTVHPGDEDGNSFMNLGLMRMARSEPLARTEPAPQPTCSFAQLWADALKMGAPKTAVAVITYDAGGYAFRIEDTPLRIVFNGKCQVTEQAGTNQNRSLLPVEQPD